MAQSKIVLFLTAMRTLVLGVLSLGLLAAATWASLWMIENEPQMPRATRPHIAPSVLAEEVHSEDTQVSLTVHGTVIPAVTVNLQAEVGGRVLMRHPELVEGGLIRAGEILVEIDPRDYEHVLTAREAQLESAKSDLRIEQGQQEVARAEWEVFGLGDEASETDKELALRVPQLRRREAEIEAAMAQVEQARLDLERTKIRAPFNAVVQTTNIEVGDQATPQRNLGQLVGTDAFWIRATVKVDELKWITFPGEDTQGSPVTVYSSTGSKREGRVYKLLPDLEPDGRMARILVEVEDPLDLKHNTGQLPLLLEDYVRVEITGKHLEGVTRLSRSMLRDARRVWLVDNESNLHFLEPEIIWEGETEILVRGIPENTQVITSNLGAPVDGMAVRLPGAEIPVVDSPTEERSSES